MGCTNFSPNFIGDRREELVRNIEFPALVGSNWTTRNFYCGPFIFKLQRAVYQAGLVPSVPAGGLVALQLVQKKKTPDNKHT